MQISYCFQKTLSTQSKSEYPLFLLSVTSSAKSVHFLEVLVSVCALHLSVGVNEVQDLDLRFAWCELGDFRAAC